MKNIDEQIEELDAIINLYKADPADGLRNKIWEWHKGVVQKERAEAVRGFATDFIETGSYEGVNSIEDIIKLWRKYND
jgi:hypothetical protein